MVIRVIRVAFMKQKYSKFWYVVGVLVAANIAAAVALAQAGAADFAKLYFFDIGQGDAIYLRTHQGNDILIDTGPGDAVLSKLGEAMPFADRTLELVILTHPHADHISGMVEILKRYKVETIILPEVDYDSATYNALRQQYVNAHTLVMRPKLGQRIYLDDSTVLDIFYPILGKFERQPKDINDASIVARLSFGQSNVLLMGDAGKSIERFLVKLGLPLASEILKVGHHGSHHSSAENFLQAVDSDYNIISVGKNSYGHPHEEVLGIFLEHGKELLRTDQHGDIAFKIYPRYVILAE